MTALIGLSSHRLGVLPAVVGLGLPAFSAVTCGGDAAPSTWLSLLRVLPDTPETRSNVLINDHARARELGQLAARLGKLARANFVLSLLILGAMAAARYV
jgi:hypothetical protein